jgi:RNA polymerase sigma-70 factor (ECF subfamily)
MRDLADERLMQHYASGDMRAFEELYRRYRGPLYRYFRRQVSDPATANDLYQGSWEKIIGARHRYRAKAPFRAWVFRIARNHLVDFYRRQRPTASLDQGGYFMDLPGPEPEPETVLEGADQERRLRQAILNLSPEQRDALLLKLESGLALDEIATMTGVGRETVKSRLRYATAQLRKVLSA